MSVESVIEKLTEISISPSILPLGDSTPGLSEEDAKVSQLLELLDEYEKLANDDMRINYVNGFQDLSRANYNGTKKHGAESFDLRPYVACTVAENNGEWNLVDRLGEQIKREKERKESEKREKEKREKEDKVVEGEETGKTDGEENDLELDEKIAETVTSSISKSSGQLRNRKNKTKESKLHTIDSNLSSPSPKPSLLYRNPINQFGGLVPYQLRSAQDHFKKALADSVRLVNLQQKISALVKEIET